MMAFMQVNGQNYIFTINNDVQISDRILEFDLYILNTNSGTPFELGGIQAGILVNPAIYNGGNLSISIVPGTSDLNIFQAPTSVIWSQTQNTIKLTPKAPPGTGNGTILSTTAPGSRVCRLRITNDVAFAQASADLTFNFSTVPYPTKVAEYIAGINTQLLSDASNCYSLASNPILNNIIIPVISGNSTACAGSTTNVYTTQPGMTNYLWTVSGGGTVTAGGTTSDNTVTVTWDTEGPQSVSVNFTDGGLTAPIPTEYPVTVNAVPVPSITGPVTSCVSIAGNVYTTEALMTGYSWSVTNGTINSGLGTNSISVTWNVSGPQSVSVNYTNSNNCTASSPTLYIVQVDPASVGGTIAPVTLTSIVLGQTTDIMTLSGYVGAIVKWQERLGAGTWIDMPNTTTTFSDSPNAIGTWEYRAVIQSGSCSIAYSSSSFVDVTTSSAGTVTGGSSPLCLGSSTGTMTLSGYTGTIVKWQKHVDAGLWTDILNTTTTYSEIPSSAGTWEYRAVVNNGTDLTSAPATIIVDPPSAGGAVTGGTTICSGSTSGLLTLAGQTGTVVRWQSSVSPFTSWTDIANTATTYTSGALTATTQFRAVVQSGSCAVAYSTPTTVTVDPPSAGGAVTGGTTICSGSTSGLLNPCRTDRHRCQMAEFSITIYIMDRYSQYGNNIIPQEPLQLPHSSGQLYRAAVVLWHTPHQQQ